MLYSFYIMHHQLHFIHLLLNDKPFFIAILFHSLWNQPELGNFSRHVCMGTASVSYNLGTTDGLQVTENPMLYIYLCNSSICIKGRHEQVSITKGVHHLWNHKNRSHKPHEALSRLSD